MKDHNISLGDFELTAISDGTYVADGGAFFGIIPKVMWEKKTRADANGGSKPDRRAVMPGENSIMGSRGAAVKC